MEVIKPYPKPLKKASKTKQKNDDDPADEVLHTRNGDAVSQCAISGGVRRAGDICPSVRESLEPLTFQRCQTAYQCPNSCRELVLPFVPGAPLPRCPVCGRAFVPNLRLLGDKFVPSRQYGERLAAQARFIGRAKRLLIFELGCSANGRLGANAAIISDMLMSSNENFHVLRINKYEAFALPGLERQTLLFDEQIGKVLRNMLALRPAKRRGRPKYSPPARLRNGFPQ